MIAAVILLISDLLTLTVFSGDITETVTNGAYLVDGGARLLAGALLLLGLVGMYARQSEVAGALGLAGFLVAFTGTVLVLGTWWTNVFAAPSLATEAPAFLEAGPSGVPGFGFTISFALGALGWLLLGLASLRARVYPRAAAAALVVGAALTFAPLPVAGGIFYAAMVWLGLLLLSRKQAPCSSQSA